MVLDSSAVVAILVDEPEAVEFAELLAEADDPVLSAASLSECSIVMHKSAGMEGIADLDDLLIDAGIRCADVDLDQALAARDAWLRFGKGQSPARLNFGDCFSYALAVTLARPLLFKGADFGQTDLRSARREAAIADEPDG